MPELPEVQTIVTGLARRCRGAVIRRVIVNRPDFVRYGGAQLIERLLGARIVDIVREGKRIVLQLEGAARLVFHLGMSGRLTLESEEAAIQGHTHFQVRFEGQMQELRFRDPRRFGGVWFFDGAEDGMDVSSPPPAGSGDQYGAGRNTPSRNNGNGALRKLGPDALSIRVPILRGLARRKRQIKAMLMDQDSISGLGNIYCDEALFAARIHPITRACDLTDGQVRSLACSIRKILRAALAAGGSTLMDYRQADGREGRFQARHRVYGREGLPCPRCRKKIKRIVAAGRSTHFCANCQMGP